MFTVNLYDNGRWIDTYALHATLAGAEVAAENARRLDTEGREYRVESAGRIHWRWTQQQREARNYLAARNG